MRFSDLKLQSPVAVGLAFVLALVAQGCGRPQGSTLATVQETATDQGDGYGDGAGDGEYSLIDDDDVESELGDSDYEKVADQARVKVFARGANGECSDWVVEVRASADEETSLASVFLKPKLTEKRRDGDGVYGAEEEDGKEVLLTKKDRGNTFGELILRARTHGARDGMVLLAPVGSKLSISASYKPCEGGDEVTFPETVLDVKNGRQKFSVKKGVSPTAKEAAVIVKIKLPKEKKAKKSKGSGKGATAE